MAAKKTMTVGMVKKSSEGILAKSDEAEKQEVGRPTVYTEEKRKTLSVKLYESKIERVKSVARDEFSGNMTMAVDSLLEEALKSRGV